MRSDKPSAYRVLTDSYTFRESPHSQATTLGHILNARTAMPIARVIQMFDCFAQTYEVAPAFVDPGEPERGLFRCRS